MNSNQIVRTFAAGLASTSLFASLLPAAAFAAEADYHHVHLTTSNATEATKWYTEYLDCQPLTDRDDGVDCFGTEVVFESRATLGSSQRTGIDHISFSYADLTTKMDELSSVGVGGSGVRLQRFEDGSTQPKVRRGKHRSSAQGQTDSTNLRGQASARRVVDPSGIYEWAAQAAA